MKHESRFKTNNRLQHKNAVKQRSHMVNLLYTSADWTYLLASYSHCIMTQSHTHTRFQGFKYLKWAYMGFETLALGR